MANDVQVNWYQDDVMLALAESTADILRQAAFQLEGHTKANIRDNGQIDTGFMLNTVYTVVEDGDSYGETWQPGTYSSPTGQAQQHDKAPRVQLGSEDTAAVAVAAEYSIYQEVQQSFLYRALEQTQQEVGGIVQAVARARDIS